MEKKNIIIISAAGLLVILIAAWFIFDPFGNGNNSTVKTQSAVNEQPAPPPAEIKKDTLKADTTKQEKKKAVQNGESGIYIVKDGDTLQKISVDFFGETKYWIDIFAANEPNIDWYDNIKPGMELIIPEIN
ncbi:MAG: LysM peptidoglycan-binding domain-containing protein [Bacteroidetes bacterium]|nr:LysM peptidoglycan-binding domain-containing protein [Bacteroidota bacterium]